MTSEYASVELAFVAGALYEALLAVQETYAGWHPARQAADSALARYEELTR